MQTALTLNTTILAKMRPCPKQSPQQNCLQPRHTPASKKGNANFDTQNQEMCLKWYTYKKIPIQRQFLKMSNHPCFLFLHGWGGGRYKLKKWQIERKITKKIRNKKLLHNYNGNCLHWLVEVEPWMNALTTEELTNIKLKVKWGKVQSRMLWMQFNIFPRHGSDEWNRKQK